MGDDKSENNVSRRGFLETIAGASAAASAGCIGDENEGGQNSETEEMNGYSTNEWEPNYNLFKNMKLDDDTLIVETPEDAVIATKRYNGGRLLYARKITLLTMSGKPIETKDVLSAADEYHFDGLSPGVYTVSFETQQHTNRFSKQVRAHLSRDIEVSTDITIRDTNFHIDTNI